MKQLIEKEIQTLQKFYKFNYPVYSGTSIQCIECGNEEWISGQEFKDNKDSYLVDLFQHKSTCSVNDKIQKSINEPTSEDEFDEFKDNEIISLNTALETATNNYKPLSEDFIKEYKDNENWDYMSSDTYIKGYKEYNDTLKFHPDVTRLQKLSEKYTDDN